MFKKISVFFVAVMLAGCSSISDMTSNIPFIGKDKKVIDLDKDKIDQKSYAASYEATVATYKGRVTKHFFVDNFASGANDWYLGRIVVPIKQIQEKLYTGGHESEVYAYYSGVLHAEALQANFSPVEFRTDVKKACPNATDKHLKGKIFSAEDVKGILMDDQKELSLPSVAEELRQMP